jgi:hypothetical protein
VPEFAASQCRAPDQKRGQRGWCLFSRCVILPRPTAVLFRGGPGDAVMRWIAIVLSIIGRGAVIATVGAGAFVIADYALDWL